MIHPDPNIRPSVKEIIQKLEKFEENKEIEKNSRFDVMDKSQVSTIQNDLERSFFKEFMRREISIESLLFFEDLELFTKLDTEQERFFKAEEIYYSYLNNSSELEINIPQKLLQKIDKDLSEEKLRGKVNVYIFDEIGKHISKTILNDTFRRYTSSDIYEEMKSQKK
jgi:hypothetical protein